MGNARHARRFSAAERPGKQEGAVQQLGRVRVAALAVRRDHAVFCRVLGVAAVVRLVIVLGYPPALWFADSLPYVQVFPLSPGPVRPAGYSFFLALLEPLHSVWLITFVQALMGLATATAVYAVLRRYKLTGGAATLAAAPVLFSVYQLQMEHFVLSDTLFGLLVTVAVVLVMWWPVPPVGVFGLTGLVLAWATMDREQGLLLPVPFCVYLGAQVARHVPIRAILGRIAALCLTLVVPLLVYGWWFEGLNGSFALTSSTGVFLYSRVSTFARCSVIKPPADERWLCISTSPRKRPDPNFYAWSVTSPINVKPPGGWAFDSRANSLATNFALRAIQAQPADYLDAVWQSITQNFEPQFEHSAAWYSERQYNFPSTTPQPLRALARFNREQLEYASGVSYNGRQDPSTRVVQPFAGWMQAYQRIVIMPGPMLALIALAGLAGIAAAWRRLGGQALLPWLTGVVLIVTPAATTGYGARYLIASVPTFCIAAAIGIRQIIEARSRPAGAGDGL